ncbi:peroxidase-like [Cloeon dipterum]|uniref:peroxidase-like n=1 Tax=Cloeon dipterum TaxID=197152 RepID=UPI00321F933D
MNISESTPLYFCKFNSTYERRCSLRRKTDAASLIITLLFFAFLVVVFGSVVVLYISSSLPFSSDIEANNKTNDSSSQLGITLMAIQSNSFSSACKVFAVDPSISEVNEALANAERDWQERLLAERNHPAVPLPPSHPSFLHQRAIYSSKQSVRAMESAHRMLSTSKYVYAGKLKSGDCIVRGLRLAPSNWSAEWCTEPIKCDTASPYRTIDGSCNNIVHPGFGVAMRPFKRLLMPSYGDGISTPRKWLDPNPLPLPRKVSFTIHRPSNQTNPKFTANLAAWGQFIDHDITATALSKRADGQAITCCNTEWQHPECYPVIIPPDDPLYGKYNLTCTDFVRSAPAPVCTLGPRENLNQVTPFIDGSTIYGANKELESQVRAFSGGLLHRSWTSSGIELLPIDRTSNDGCNRAEQVAKGRFCFKTGDTRSNENLPLTTLHLIFSRQHNRLATALKKLNPQWMDEVLYQEARKIVIAQLQHIHYNEFLPVVLGYELAEKLDVLPKASGFFEAYDASVDPQITNEFASCAFRFGHTLLQGQLALIDRIGVVNRTLKLHETLFNPFGMYQNEFVEDSLRGISESEVKGPGSAVTSELQGNLFKTKSSPCGLDLVTLNIQRGRDHGLPGYPLWRELCGGARPKTFDDLLSTMDAETVERLKLIYDSVDDIDPFTGLVSEKPLNSSGILGPTGTCVIAEQFLRLKRADRFWYETPEAPQAFTQAQLEEIRKTSLSSLFCENSETTEMQPRAMESLTDENALTLCSNFPKLNLNLWIDVK